MSDRTNFTEFPIEFFNEYNDDLELYNECERRLLELRGNRNDMTAASVSVREAQQGTESGVTVNITIEVRPDTAVATVTAPSAKAAMKGALDNIERQVREQRERLRGY